MKTDGCHSADKDENIHSVFKKTGIYPFEPNKVKRLPSARDDASADASISISISYLSTY